MPGGNRRIQKKKMATRLSTCRHHRFTARAAATMWLPKAQHASFLPPATANATATATATANAKAKAKATATATAN